MPLLHERSRKIIHGAPTPSPSVWHTRKSTKNTRALWSGDVFTAGSRWGNVWVVFASLSEWLFMLGERFFLIAVEFKLKCHKSLCFYTPTSGRRMSPLLPVKYLSSFHCCSFMPSGSMRRWGGPYDMVVLWLASWGTAWMLFIPMSPIPEKTSKQLGEVIRDSDVCECSSFGLAQIKCHLFKTFDQYTVHYDRISA